MVHLGVWNDASCRSMRVQWFLGRCIYVDVGLAIHTGRFSMPQVVGEGWSNLHIYSTLFLHAFWHLVLSESLAALSKIDSLLQCYYKNWMELVRFYCQTVECVFNIIHIEHVFVDIFHGTFRVPAPMQVALCAPPVNLERVSGQMSEPAISHQSCTASGFAVIEFYHRYIYIYHIHIYIV